MPVKILLFILIFTSSSYANMNTLTGWDGGNLSSLNDNLRQISSKTGLQQISILNDLSSSTSLSVLNENIALIGRQLSIPGLSAITGYTDTNLSVLNYDLALIGQNTGA